MSDKVKNVLSLDGGGLKGIYALILLSEFEKKYSLSGKIDLFLGTSIGSVISSALALGIDASAQLEHFQNKIDNRKLSDFLQIFLSEIFEQKQFGEISKKVFFPVYDYTNKQRTYFGIDSPINVDDVPIVEVLTAVCSDMRVFPPFKIQSIKTSFYDAGIFAYDPVMFFMRNRDVSKMNKLNILSLGLGVAANISSDLDQNEKFDIMYDTIIEEQFSNTLYFFHEREGKYLRITEFPIRYEKLTLEHISHMAYSKSNIDISNFFASN